MLSGKASCKSSAAHHVHCAVKANMIEEYLVSDRFILRLPAREKVRGPKEAIVNIASQKLT